MGLKSVKCTAIFALFLPMASAAVTEAEVFDWWDAGIITPEQADEILTLLDEGNTEEACLLAEVYAQEPCVETAARQALTAQTRARKTAAGRTQKTAGARSSKTARPPLRPSGYVLSKIRLDSTGHVESHREELKVDFYRYTLRLGTQEILTYRNAGSEAHFGDISTKELHSHIPLDTLWGTAALYPFGNFHTAALLDSSMVTQARAGYDFDKQTSIEAIYWHGKATPYRDHFHSATLQAKFDFGKASAWYQAGQDAPLLKIEFHNTAPPKKRGSPQEPITFDWRTTAYYHGDSIPTLARLSSTILKSRLWGSQTVGATAKEWFNTRAEANMRIINPLHSDSASTRVKAMLISGPAFARAALTVTCRELQDNCRQSDWKPSFTSSFTDHWSTGASARARYTRGEGFGPPRLEASLRYQDVPGNYAKVTLVAPKGKPSEAFQIRNEAHFSGPFLGVSIVSTFKKNVNVSLHPSQGSLMVKLLF